MNRSRCRSHPRYCAAAQVRHPQPTSKREESQGPRFQALGSVEWKPPRSDLASARHGCAGQANQVAGTAGRESALIKTDAMLPIRWMPAAIAVCPGARSWGSEEGLHSFHSTIIPVSPSSTHFGLPSLLPGRVHCYMCRYVLWLGRAFALAGLGPRHQRAQG